MTLNQQTEQGFVLIPVLWILGMLAVALSTASLFTTNSMATISLVHGRVQAEALVRAGVESAVYRIRTSSNGLALEGHERVLLTNAYADVSWASEAGRLDINLAPGDLISSLLVRMGAEPRDADIIAANIVDRRRQGPVQQSAIRPANMTPFRHFRELAGLGIPDSLLTRIKPFLTVYSGTAKIDPRVASIDLLASLPGLTEARMRGLADLRIARSSDPNSWVAEAAEAASYLQFAPSKVMRLRIDGRGNAGSRRLAEIVAILFSDDREPYRILDWDYVESNRDFTPLDTLGP